MPISLSFEQFPECPKCSGKVRDNILTARLLPVYEFSGGNPQAGVTPNEILYWKCSNPKCGLTVEP